MSKDEIEEYSATELMQLDDFDFAEAVTDNLLYTQAFSSPFQEPSVVERTAHALVEQVWRVEATIQKQAEDPNCSAERYERTLGFRRMLLQALDLTDRRIQANVRGSGNRELSAWKALAHQLAGIIEGGMDDRSLDDVRIPRHAISVRQWMEVRDTKDPDRVPAKDVAA